MSSTTQSIQDMPKENSHLPLSGIKILDFSGLLPGPYASRLLADLGAEIVRVEAPDRLDLVRIMPPLKNNQSTIDSYLNKGKRSIALNLKDPEVIELIKSSLSDFDIIMEQNRPGIMEKLGLSYDQIKQTHPEIIYCSITGYGQTGCLSARAGHDINYLSLAGCVDYSRRKDQRPTPYSVQVADVAGGSHNAVMAILAALYQRTTTNQGRYIDISMTDAALNLNVMSAAASLHGEEIVPQEQILQAKSYYDFYETKDGRYFSVGSLEPKFITGLCAVINRTDLISKAISQRTEDIEVFKIELETYFSNHTYDELQAVFAKCDICVEPVLTLQEALAHPHFQERGLVVSDEHGSSLKSPLQYVFDTSDPKSLSSESCGQSTDWFLKKQGINDNAIAELRKRRAVK